MPLGPRSALLLASLALNLGTGCATTRGAAGAEQEFTGQPYSVRYSGPPLTGSKPPGAAGPLGRVTGLICGQDVTYDVQADGDRVSLDGFLGTGTPSRLTLRAAGDERAFSGSLGIQAGDAAVELRLTPQTLQGRVGFRYFDLQRQGDELSGPMRVAGVGAPTTATLQGADALWALPAPVQAAVLPNLLTCFVARVGVLGLSPLTVRVGGPPGAQPRGSSSVRP